LRLRGHNLSFGVCALVGVGALLAASACEFDATANPSYGCDGCRAPDSCVDGFCVRLAAASQLRDAGRQDAGRQTEGAAGGMVTCEPGSSELCYDGPQDSDQYPPCRVGRKSCSAEGTFGACLGQVVPVEETCNGNDDDCDGMIDEQLMRDGLVCSAGRFSCSALPLSVAELCDGLDNDCDGENDEDFDLASDPQHCGRCGLACPQGQSCCDGECFDLASEGEHCGTCGKRCSRGTTCCGGECVDTSTDPDHCGECGESCAGTLGCCGGQCVDSQTDRDHCGPFCLNCAEGEACCFGACADLDSFQHCGSCERVCGANELCCDGNCSTTACE
jgi:hypothetical protein